VHEVGGGEDTSTYIERISIFQKKNTKKSMVANKMRLQVRDDSNTNT
jgi:hypothetical protein